MALEIAGVPEGTHTIKLNRIKSERAGNGFVTSICQILYDQLRKISIVVSIKLMTKP